MSAVSWFRGAQTALVEKTLPKRVVFHHVPKCGGTSFARALRRRYILSQAGIRAEQSFWAANLNADGSDDQHTKLLRADGFRVNMMAYHLENGVRCVAAHVPFSPNLHDRFAPDCAFVTLLRDPVDRFLSHYRWSFGRPNAHGAITEPFDQFLDSPRAAWLGATICTYFAGFTPDQQTLNAPETIGAAVANLNKLDVVGRIEDLGAFQQQVQGALSVKLRIGHENRGKSGVGKGADLTDAQMAKVRQLCAPDLAIWDQLG